MKTKVFLTFEKLLVFCLQFVFKLIDLQRHMYTKVIFRHLNHLVLAEFDNVRLLPLAKLVIKTRRNERLRNQQLKKNAKRLEITYFNDVTYLNIFLVLDLATRFMKF